MSGCRPDVDWMSISCRPRVDPVYLLGRQSHTDYMRHYQHRPGVEAYRQQYEKDNADRRKARARELYAYQCSWGGDKAYHNNMLSIEPTLFT